MKFMTIIKILILVYTIYLAAVNDFLWMYIIPVLVLIWIFYSCRKKKHL